MSNQTLIAGNFITDRLLYYRFGDRNGAAAGKLPDKGRSYPCCRPAVPAIDAAT